MSRKRHTEEFKIEAVIDGVLAALGPCLHGEAEVRRRLEIQLTPLDDLQASIFITAKASLFRLALSDPAGW